MAKYPARYRWLRDGLIVEFIAQGDGVTVDVGEDFGRTLGEHRTDWTGPEDNDHWALVEMPSVKSRLHLKVKLMATLKN